MNSTNSVEPGWWTSHEVARLVRMSPSAVLRWIDQGLIQAFRTPGGHRRVRSTDLIAFLKSQHLPVPPELRDTSVRLVVIDDESRYLSALGRLLKEADPRIEVELFDHPVEALIQVGKSRPDVVLVDAYMGGLDGVGLCRRLKASPETAGIAILAMSGSPSPELEEAFQLAGAAKFLPKPLTPEAVLKELHALGLVAPRAER